MLSSCRRSQALSPAALTAIASMQQIDCTSPVAGTHAHLSLQVTGHNGQEKLGEALKGADLVIIPAGVPRKPGMTRDDLFNINASIVQKLAEGVAEHAPKVRTMASGWLPVWLKSFLHQSSSFQRCCPCRSDVHMMLSQETPVNN